MNFRNIVILARVETLMVTKVRVLFFWIMTPWWRRQHVPKRRHPNT